MDGISAVRSSNSQFILNDILQMDSLCKPNCEHGVFVHISMTLEIRDSLDAHVILALPKS